jgi:UDP:flavonoid glycosyltransferase YjiC (YdhE family)
MKITLFAAGSRGDIQPCIALSQGLQRAGYRVQLAAPQDFAPFIHEHGVPFAPLRGDVQELMASDTGRSFMETGGGNPIKSIRTIRTLIGPVVMEMAEDLYAACRDADAIISLGVFAAFTRSVAEALDIPVINLEPTPLLPTRAFPAPSWPVQKNLGGPHNYLSGLAMLRVVWLWYRPFVNAFRERLGLTPLTGGRFIANLQATPMLGAYSPRIIPHPPDWPESLHVTGYLFLDAQTDWQPPPALQAFLDVGEPPVYIGFGSMAGRTPDELARLVMDALARSGRRGVLLTGWGGMDAGQATDSVFVAESIPHSWLFPRMAAVVHHGGAGTIAEGLRAGVPTVVVPFILDQPFWGARIKAMGLGPEPIPRKQLTADRLAHAIDLAVAHAEIRQRAQACGRAIRAEDGVGNAVELVTRYLGMP